MLQAMTQYFFKILISVSGNWHERNIECSDLRAQRVSHHMALLNLQAMILVVSANNHPNCFCFHDMINTNFNISLASHKPGSSLHSGLNLMFQFYTAQHRTTSQSQEKF